MAAVAGRDHYRLPDAKGIDITAALVATGIGWFLLPSKDSAASATAPLFLVLAVIFQLAESIHAHLSWGGGFGFISGFGAGGLLEAIGYHMYQPTTLFMLALLAFNLRLLWVRWKRAAPTDFQIYEIDPRRFARCWLTLAALTVITVPTVAAVGFAFWLGPWYRW